MTNSMDDPFEVFMHPPAKETPQERKEREDEEKWQRQRNIEIEELLREERATHKPQNQVRLLLVGQSESGKSTILKNFQIANAPRAFRAERATWTRIIYLNIARAVNSVCQAVTLILESQTGTPASSTPAAPHTVTEEHRTLVQRLSPLRDLETKLRKQLTSPSDAQLFQQGGGTQEFFVRSHSHWQRSWTVRRGSFETQRSSHEENQMIDTNREVISQLLDSRDDMLALWASPNVRAMLIKRKVKLEDSAPFFLDNLGRIIERNYEPSDDDIVRARLRTVGVQEYRIVPERALPKEIQKEWLLFDVGGSRSQRAAWVPFFEHMHAIIFLAPINCFNERLSEDKALNRLEDSFDLYRIVVGSPLLKMVQIILFMNKVDLLAKLIDEGVQLKKYIPSYADRSNDFETIVKYFLRKFKDSCRVNSPQPRQFYAYRTSAVDIATTSATLILVRDGILRDHLKNAALL